eukprot:2934285-Amphidinium_carterae.1
MNVHMPHVVRGVMSPRGSRAAPRRQGSAGSRLGESSPRNNGQQVPTMATAASATHADNGHGLLTPAVQPKSQSKPKNRQECR